MSALSYVGINEASAIFQHSSCNLKTCSLWFRLVENWEKWKMDLCCGLLEMNLWYFHSRNPFLESPKNFWGAFRVTTSKWRRLEARNFAFIPVYFTFTTYEKSSFAELAIRSFMNGFLELLLEDGHRALKQCIDHVLYQLRGFNRSWH